MPKQKTGAQKKASKPRTKAASANGAPLLVALTVDMSGSMGAVRDAAIEGLNDYIGSLKKQDGEVLATLTVWDTEAFEELAVAVPVADCPLLTTENYTPRGGTPLYDAIGKTVAATRARLLEEGREGAKALVVVLTDGFENSSREYNRQSIAQMVRDLEAEGNWTFVYLGAGHGSLRDAQVAAAGMGYSSGNAMMFRHTGQSVAATTDSLTSATVAYAGSASPSTSSFFVDAGQSAKDYSGEGAPPKPLKGKPPAKAPQARKKADKGSSGEAEGLKKQSLGDVLGDS